MPYHNVKPDTIVMITVMNGIRPRRPPADALTDEYWNYINILWGDTPDSRPRAHEAHTALLSLHDLGVLYAPPSPASPTEPLPDLSEYVKYPDAHISAFSGHVDVQIGRLEMNGNISTVGVCVFLDESAAPTSLLSRLQPSFFDSTVNHQETALRWIV